MPDLDFILHLSHLMLINVTFWLLYRIWCYCFVFQSIAEKVSQELLCNDDTINYIFTLLAHKKTFINACQLIEDMLQSRREVLDLHRISEYIGLLRSKKTKLIECMNEYLIHSLLFSLMCVLQSLRNIQAS